MKIADLREAMNSSIDELKAYNKSEAELESVVHGDAADGSATDLPEPGILRMLRLILTEVRIIQSERAEIVQLRQDYEALQGVVTQQ